MALGVFAGAVVCGFTGFAFSAVAGAVLLHVLRPSEAVPLMMVCSILVQSVCLVSLRRQIQCQWRGSLMLVVGGLLGLPPALYVLLHAEPAPFRIGFGVFLTAYASFMLLRPALRYFESARGTGYDAAVGLMGGLVGGVTAMPGAVPPIWYDRRGGAREARGGWVQRDSSVSQVAALESRGGGRGLPEAVLGDVLGSLAALGAGSLVGLALFGRVRDGPFRRVLLGVLLLPGL